MAGDDGEERRIAALLLRGAREQADDAKEHGLSAYLADGRRPQGPGRVNERLLKGEVNQARSFNKRAGVDTADLPAMPAEAHATPLERQTLALDREFVRRAHALREAKSGAPQERPAAAQANRRKADFGDRSRADVFSNFGDKRGSFGWGAAKLGACHDFARGACSRGENCRFAHDSGQRFGDILAPAAGAAPLANGEAPPAPAKKRQRVGANGATLDIVAAAREAARQTEEDFELACPLMRGPTPAAQTRPAAKKKVEPATGASTSGAIGAGAVESWASKKLRVRIVDEAGEFRRFHLRKGVVRAVDAGAGRADVELEGEAETLRAVPQKLLETVVSKSCRNVEILRGPHRGMLARFLGKDVKRNTASVQLGRGEDAVDIDIKLDDICEFV